MNTERIKEIQNETAYPDSISVQQALLRVWNECEQEKASSIADVMAMLPSSETVEENGMEGGLRDGELQMFWEGAEWLKCYLQKRLLSKGQKVIDINKERIYQLNNKLDMKNDQSNTNEKGMAYDRLLCAGLNDAAKQIHEDAKRKGFWDRERETGTLLMLCVSELSEALEADREGRFANIPLYDKESVCSGDIASFKLHIKDTFEDEIADTVIRLLDLCGARGIDIERHINLKLKYNRSRERMHGKAY